MVPGWAAAAAAAAMLALVLLVAVAVPVEMVVVVALEAAPVPGRASRLAVPPFLLLAPAARKGSAGATNVAVARRRLTCSTAILHG